MGHEPEPGHPRHYFQLPAVRLSGVQHGEARPTALEEGGRCEGYSLTHGLYTHAVHEGEQISLCCEGHGPAQQGGSVQLSLYLNFSFKKLNYLLSFSRSFFLLS